MTDKKSMEDKKNIASDKVIIYTGGGKDSVFCGEYLFVINEEQAVPIAVANALLAKTSLTFKEA